MFTGIVKATGALDAIDARGGDSRFTLRSDGLDWKQFEPGESIAVNGVCLTAVELLDDGFVTDVSRETLSVTALGRLKRGSRVNLEPALRLSDRLGGHLVTGHVDCMGAIRSMKEDARSLRLEIAVPKAFLRYMAKKGSVCVDGVSLTINEVSEDEFSVNIIPHTVANTIIGDYGRGTEVNIEVDLVARYLESLLKGGDAAGISREFLKAHGYA